MSFIQFQIATDAFLGLQRSALQQAQVCPPSPVTINGIQLLVDHVEFADSTIRHNVMGTQLVYYEDVYGDESITIDALQTQIAQRVLIYATTMSDVLTHPNQAPASIVELGMTAILDLVYYPIGANCYFRAVFDSLEFDPFPPLPGGIDENALKNQLQQLVLSLFPSPAIPLDFANLLSGAAVKVENAGVSVNAAGTFLAFAAQLGGALESQADVFWKPFYAGNITD
jgi:hypothetical protein